MNIAWLLVLVGIVLMGLGVWLTGWGRKSG